MNEQHTGDLFWQKHLVDGQMIHISGPKMQRSVNISGLKSGQAYAARVEVFYQSDQPYTWPTTNFSIFHTQCRLFSNQIQFKSLASTDKINPL